MFDIQNKVAVVTGGGGVKRREKKISIS